MEMQITEYGAQKNEQADILYNYLIDTAKEKAKNYSTNSSEQPTQIDTTTLKYENSNGNYIVGPIKFSETGNSTLYTIRLEVKDGDNNIQSVNLLDEGKQNINTELNNIKELAGKEFYLSIPQSDVTISNLKLTITTEYSNTKLTLWGSSTDNNAQPVVIPEKEKKSVPITLTTEKKNFDLALRKYITKINEKELNGNESREPKIEKDTLKSGTTGTTTTASYKHKKDPVPVETGDKVTYKITIYNEGEKAGRATKIVDQLPAGLKYVRVVSGNFKVEEQSYDENGENKLILERNSNNENLNPYKVGQNLDSETIEIECQVTAKPDTHNNSQILTNVAWIAEEVDSESNITIENQENADRDSKPATTPPNVKKDNISDYKGNSNKENLSDSDFYYQGYEDDDDFEKVVLMPESFDLKLIKRITKVNNQEVPERIKDVNVSKLNTTDNGKLVTTGEYKLDKNPVQVKKGDIVTYTFRIYNEGTLDGYASKITEDIPEGLEFLWSEDDGEDLQNNNNLTQAEKEAIEFNQNYLWGDFEYKDDKIVQVSTDYLSKARGLTSETNLIKAFGKNDGTKTKEDIQSKEVSIKLKVVADNVTGTIIRNEAEISGDTDKEGNEINDRDSDTEQWKKEQDNKYYDENNKWAIYKEDDEDYDNITLTSFDLSLRKFIIAVSSDTNIEESEYLKNRDGTYKRSPVVDTEKLNTQDENGNLITTATYNHTKEPVLVKKGDYVIYMLRVYNEGDLDGYASEIKDHLPPYLEFVQGDFNNEYGWTTSDNGRTVTTTYLNDHKITKATKNEAGKYVLAYNNKELKIMCKVKDTVEANENITNIADITKYQDESKKDITDRDSQANNVSIPEDEELPSYKNNETGEYIPGQQDDDDFEKVYVKPDEPQEPNKIFDLALRKFITKIADEDVTTRVPQVKYEDGSIKYEHSKDPLLVKTDDVVIYTIRVFNEGEIAGYAKEITDDIPEGLEFLPENETNKNMRWKMIDKDGKETTKVSEAVKITTDYLSKEQEKSEGANLLKEFNPDGEINETNPAHKDVQVAFKVTKPNSYSKVIVNSAQISNDSDENGKDVEDKDSIPDKWNEGEDDQDREYIKLEEEQEPEKIFDLALRKFITKIADKDVTTRIPQVKYEDGSIKYEHGKDPLMVKTDDVVIYTIRVFNEGEIAGYAKEITDDIPEGLEFLPENETNKNMRWKMIDKDGKETTKVSEAVKITTDYLSKEQEKSEGANLLKEFNPDGEINETNPAHKDVQVAFKVTKPNSYSKVIVNSAQISNDSDENGKDVEDKDSIPDKWNEGEDDQDKEYIELKEFDLALRKWVTQAIVIDNGSQTITNTGHKPYDDPEQVVKVELNRKKLDQVTVKFKYSIRVINEGDIEGYAKEVTDYIPQGLKFVASDNPGWTDEGNNVISTKLLENKLLKPGEYADIEVVLTWINNADNMGAKTNTAEISKDYNEYGLPDKDSTPDNKKQGEDDIDDAPVMLSISTGQIRIFFTIGFVILITIAGGIILIKKYVI